ncbi:thermonuclease family protein [Pseudonocardia kunmingensis]|uniref:Nuclease-like protein n=1 Tax=Pseudonocardia kunmingensis TaxID=630975 RepID=A0A543DIT9_9PSEU|nr:thermonuclease family protein [Pseudonocardia kunmingensis]TQM09257.1 nuclease-like protein [Pseudonocardia kunmingensis]
MRTGGKLLIGFVGFVVIVGSCGQAEGDPATQPRTVSALPAAQPAALPTLHEATCHSHDIVYDGDDTCHPGGELVTVRRVVDGDSLETTDGRRVRLLGVDAPEADTCAGPGAAEHMRSLVEGDEVKLHAEPGVDVDQHGRFLRYVQYAATTDRDDQPLYAYDLGKSVVLAGWATPVASSDANASYEERLSGAQGIAQYRPEGVYAPPCGEPLVYGDDGDRVEVDVDVPNVDLPDGALTGGYCAHEWC